MSAPPLAALVRRMNPGPDAVPDSELLDRFVRSSDQAAFELLVWRHGAMVWGVCRRTLHPDLDAAEDACQAAFAALARSAARFRNRDAVGAWLRRVATRAALDLRTARRAAARPLTPDFADPPARDLEPPHAASYSEVRALLDTGLDQLPTILRTPFVLCELEGRTNAEAAEALGCPVGTVESRLTRARQRLRAWLTDRGVVPAVAVVAVALPDAVRVSMVRAATPAALSPSVVALAVRATRRAPPLRASLAAALVLVGCAVGLGMMRDEPKPLAKDTPPTPAAKVAFPLPAGAVSRLGSPRLRHGAWVYDLCFSPDGKRLASVGSDRTVAVWDAATGDRVFLVRRDEGLFGRVAFAPDGRTLCAVGHSPQMIADMWRIDAAGTVTSRAPLAGNPRVRNADPAVRFSRDGSRLAIGPANGKELVVFDTGTGEAVWSAKLGDETPCGVAFALDDKAIAVTTSGGKVHLFDPTGKPVGVHAAGMGDLTNVAISPDGAMVVAAGGNGVVALDRATGKQLWKRQTRAEYTLNFSPDGKAIVCSSYGFRACTLDPADGYGGGISGKPGAYFDAMVEATSSAFSPDGAVAFGNVGGAICLFDVKSAKVLTPSADPPHEVRWLRFSRDGKTLRAWASDWFEWDVASGKQTRLTFTGWNFGEPLSPDGKLTARSVWYSGSRPVGSTDDGTRFEIRDAKTGSAVHSHPGARFQSLNLKTFTPDGKAFVGGCPDGMLRVWEIDTGKERLKLPGHRAVSQYHAFSTDGRVLVTGAYGDDRDEFPVRVYDLDAGKELAKFKLAERVVGVSVSGDGRRVAAATSVNARGMLDPREVAVVWDVASGNVLARVPQLREGKYVALSPDGRTLAVAPAWDGDIRVHEVASGAARFAFRHDGQPTGLLFSPDGRTLAAASKEAPIYVWDVAGVLGGKLPAWDDARVWDDLASKDAPRAFGAIRQLRANPDKAVRLLKERTQIPQVPANLKQLLADLDADDFAARDAATTALATAGEAVRAALAAEVIRSPSAEARRRLTDLLGRLDAQTPTRWRLVRAVEAVEGIATPEAAALLKAWANGSAGGVLASEAQSAARR